MSFKLPDISSEWSILAYIIFASVVFLGIAILIPFLIGKFAAKKFNGNKPKAITGFVLISLAVALGLFFCFGLTLKTIQGYHRSKGIEPDTGMILAGEWHTYSVVWTKTGLYFYCDGMLTWAYEDEGAQAPKSDPMDLVLTLSTRGHEWDEWGGNAYPNSYPDEMVTDWVKCYQLKK